MPQPPDLLLQVRKHIFFGKDHNKSHVIMIWIGFYIRENENCNAKIIIPNNRELYLNFNIWQQSSIGQALVKTHNSVNIA